MDQKVQRARVPEHRIPPRSKTDGWRCSASEQRTRLTGRHDAPLMVSGDSAGGNLAAVVAQRSFAWKRCDIVDVAMPPRARAHSILGSGGDAFLGSRAERCRCAGPAPRCKG
ncbi:alpha/beta hydrolase fold domain-containing protein [Variovorax sp. J22P240]|uniref:alpha/beta hydrolase fold domain-containing protein n=1 Tax=Variovorax sp. J22P240 TaxID=3053514 RepID=UPI00336565F4